MSVFPKFLSGPDEQGQGSDGGTVVKRAKRIESHALVDVKMSAWNPLSVASAVLLDLS
ncbi:MAG: hypothetical protein RI932_1803, partial [Pseudomonadota bacterium]